MSKPIADYDLPVVGAAEDTWGTTLNNNFIAIEEAFNGETAGGVPVQIAPDLAVGFWKLNNTAITVDATELNLLDGLTASTAELNLLDGVTATTQELNYVDGVTSNIQTQLNAKITDAAGTVDTANLADDAVTSAKIADNVALGGSPTTTTQASSDRSTKIATTDFVRDAIDAYASSDNTGSSAFAAATSDSITVTYGPTGKATIIGTAGRKANYGNFGTVTFNLKQGSTVRRTTTMKTMEYDSRESSASVTLMYTITGKTAGSTETWTVESSGPGSALYANIAYIGF